MAETPADVKRDIEMTRERISETLQQLERKTNVAQIVKDHPWPALAVAVGAGVLLSGSRADVKAAGATLVATRGASSKIGTVLDDVVSNLMGGLSLAFQDRIDSLVGELKTAIGAPTGGATGTGGGAQRQGFSGGNGGGPQYGSQPQGGTGMGALGNASSSGQSGQSAQSSQPGQSGSTASSASSTVSSAGSQGMSKGAETATGSWQPHMASGEHVQGLGGTSGTTPRAD